MRRERGPDIIRWVIDRMAQQCDQVTPELALQVEREARAEWGGQKVGPIAKHCDADRDLGSPAPLHPAVRDYTANHPVPVILDRHGISRATLYRLLKPRGG